MKHSDSFFKNFVTALLLNWDLKLDTMQAILRRKERAPCCEHPFWYPAKRD